jgi:hypothetical protein
MAQALKTNKGYNGYEIVIEQPNGQQRNALAHANPIHDETGQLLGAVNVLVDITEQKRTEKTIQHLEAELEQRVRDRTLLLEATILELQQTLTQVRTLHGLIPICTHCKSIRNEAGQWQVLERYLCEHTEAEFSHGICPKCLQEHYKDYFEAQ